MAEVVVVSDGGDTPSVGDGGEVNLGAPVKSSVGGGVVLVVYRSPRGVKRAATERGSERNKRSGRG